MAVGGDDGQSYGGASGKVGDMTRSRFGTVTVGALLILIVFGVALTWQRAASPTEASGDIVQVASGSSHTCALSTGGGVQCWGANFYGQLGDGTTDSRFTPLHVPGLQSGVAAITAGSTHTCALTTGAGSVEARLEEGFRMVTVGGDGGITAGTARALQMGRSAAGR